MFMCTMAGIYCWYQPIVDIFCEYFDISDFDYNWMNIISDLSGITGAIFGILYLDEWGLRQAAYISIACIFMGNNLKIISLSKNSQDYQSILGDNIPTWFYDHKFLIFNISEIFTGFMGGLNVCLCGKLARDWFPKNQTGLVVGLSVLGSHLGASLSIIVPSMITQASQIYRINYVFCATSIIGLLLVGFGYTRSKPRHPTDGSLLTTDNEQQTLLDSLYTVFSDGKFVWLLIAVSMWYSSAAIMETFLELSFKEHSYSNQFVGLILTLSNISTILTLIPGSLVSSKCNMRQIIILLRCLAILYPTACMMCTLFGLSENNHAILIAFWIVKSLLYTLGSPILLQIIFDASLGYISEAKMTGFIFILDFGITILLISLTPLIRAIGKPDSFDNLMIFHQIVRSIFFIILAIFIKRPQLKHVHSRSRKAEVELVNEESSLLDATASVEALEQYGYGTRARR